MHPKVNDVWLTDIGPFGEVSYSENWLHGCETARFQMNAGARHWSLTPGASVVPYQGSQPLWSGLLQQPSRDGSFEAAGLHTRGLGVMALDSGGDPTNIPQTAVDAAIARGAVPWKRITAMGTSAIGDIDDGLTLNALLDRYSEATGIMWRVNHYGHVEDSATPTEPRWAVLGSDDLWSFSNEDYVAHLNVRYMSGVGTYSVFEYPVAGTVAASESAAAADKWGRKEAKLDLTVGENGGYGIITFATAQAYAAAKLARIGPRMVLAEPLVLAPGQLRTLGDTPAGWSDVHAGQMVRMWGVPDRSKTAMTLHTDFVIGRLERDRTSLTLAAQGQPASNVREVIAELFTAPPQMMTID